MSDPKSRSGNVEAGCTRCARSPCVCGEGLQAWDAQRGRDAQAGRWSPSIVPDGVFTMRMEPPSPGPRPVSAEDAMKRANEACALAERAVEAARAFCVDPSDAAGRAALHWRLAEKRWLTLGSIVPQVWLPLAWVALASEPADASTGLRRRLVRCSLLAEDVATVRHAIEHELVTWALA